METPSTFREYVSNFIGQKVAVLCMRYQYRGILVCVMDNSIVLADAVAVESSGPARSVQAQTEDPIGCSICIKLDVIELFYQPQFAFAPLPSEEA